MKRVQISDAIGPAPKTTTLSGARFLRFLVLTVALVMFGDVEQLALTGSATTAAEALIGRPLTPLSYAGVARRAHRRHHYYCHGNVYYQPCH